MNAAYVDPDYIATVRKKLDLDQRQAAEIFGGGVNPFSRYENGKTKPPLALVKLLKVLERHPDLLNEIRTTWFRPISWYVGAVGGAVVFQASFEFATVYQVLGLVVYDFLHQNWCRNTQPDYPNMMLGSTEIDHAKHSRDFTD